MSGGEPRSKPRRSWYLWAIPAVVVLIALIAVSIGAIAEGGKAPAGSHTPTAATATATTTPSDPATATALASDPATATRPGQAAASANTWIAELAALPVKPELSLSNYSRVADFGPAWADVDGQPCDTRDQILKRDLVGITLSGSCEVTSGTLQDPYTGKTIHFVRGVKTSEAVQIDHVVALANAWAEGAQSLSFAQREQLANDPVELLAVDGPTNESKGDGDASQWLPADTASDCMYVEKQVTVKVKYRLGVTPAEHDAIARVLATCAGGQTSTPTPAPPVVQAPAPVPAPAPAAPAPQPAPAPPAAATQTGIHPGSYCSPKGATGISAAGGTYVCGSKGPDSHGRYHWNS